MTWDATHYLKYGTERTRAAADLAARINLEHPSGSPILVVDPETAPKFCGLDGRTLTFGASIIHAR